MPRLALRDISKTYGAFAALSGVSMTVGVGEVHALLGENGAGKSTLLKILSGILPPTKGHIEVDGEALAGHSMANARRSGIAMIHQELQQVPELTVAQNMFLGRPITRGGVLLARDEMRRRAVEALARIDKDIDPDVKISTLRVAQRQIVEIARALLFEARIIAMDEPTSSLMPAEVEKLGQIIHQLAATGVSIIYVSHKLDEVRRFCHRGTVLRDGKLVGTIELADATEEQIVSMMVGRDLTHEIHPTARTEEVALEARGLTWQNRVCDVSFTLHKGEILGFAGLMGAGRTEVLHLLAGLEKPQAGEILVNGRSVRFRSVRDAIRSGIGLLPEERKKEGIVPLRSALANAGITSLDSYSPRGLINGGKLRRDVIAVFRSLQLRPFDPDKPVRLFSGGNQQKVVIARWLVAGVKVLLLDEPTRGVDVGAKGEIYRVIRDLAAAGHAIIVVSSELPEILHISDRVMVMRNGRAVAEFGRDTMSEEAIMQYAARDTRVEEAA
ncbi:sugar ABC transporter ATP-binding protein [Acidisoma silvae]|uniref:Sugar ABC transporter ATP-binding protein n=1 Tax=Acidisoma silvae TaxID=2802396 RepID=A0A963YN63_9PROT|nr:sugar ABC transporter ATP-binding protein [Acidisoma silvae]MCB8873606.1 sugar ABC transporter ATP-binding protein [Acidisoma silvae]